MGPTELPNDPSVADTRLLLDTMGLHAVLRMLNARTPHRFTGIYRYDDDDLRSVMLFDQHNPELRRGDDAPMRATYCALVPEFGDSLAVNDARQDHRTAARAAVTPVVSYCGVLLRHADDSLFGTLCHFDLKPCQQRTGDIELLRALSPLLAGAAMTEIGKGNPAAG